MKKVTIAELVAASEKNGFPWANKQAVRSDGAYLNEHFTENHVYSCVVGQGIANLGGNSFTGIDPSRLKLEIVEAFNEIFNYNDYKAGSYADAVRFMKEKLAPFYDEEVVIGWDYE